MSPAAPDPIRWLGIDTATADTCVAVCAVGDRSSAGEPHGRLEVLSERRVGPDSGPRPRPAHTRSLLGAIESALAEAGGWSGVEAIAVGTGPGSFTGVRIGVASARAIAQARALPIAGVSSTAALALGIGQDASRDRIGAIDARRGEVFLGIHRAGSRRAEPPALLDPDGLGPAMAGLAAPLAAGDGAVRFRDRFEAAGAEVPPDSDPVHRLGARFVCALGPDSQAGLPEAIRPTYLRRPDAELWRERDGLGSN